MQHSDKCCRLCGNLLGQNATKKRHGAFLMYLSSVIRGHFIVNLLQKLIFNGTETGSAICGV